MQVAYILGTWTTFQAAQWQVIFNSVVVEKKSIAFKIMDWCGIQKLNGALSYSYPTN